MEVVMEDLFKSAAAYAARGWRSLRIYGLRDDEKTCTCRLGAACGTPGKHPVDPGWQDMATTDEDTLARWFDGGLSVNIGVALGPQSGIVDIEWDDEGGKATAERFGLTSAETPTYQSHRSEHRLFQYDSRLPQQAVIKIGGLEVRTGGGKKGAQSVFPPSLHASGVQYRWKYGFSPDEVDVSPIPDVLMQAILNQASGGSGGEIAVKAPATEILHKTAAPGERHHALVRIAARLCMQMTDQHDPQEQQDVLVMLKSINKTQCIPPKTDQEVEVIWRSELRWAIKVRATGTKGEEAKEVFAAHISGDDDAAEAALEEIDSPFTLTGLEYRDGEWWPGQWKLKVVHSDPVAYILSLPVFSRGETRTVDVTMDAETYRSAAKVACAVLEATHTVILDSIPEEWGRIWCGAAARARAGLPAVRGLKAKLMDTASQEDATAENMRSAKVAGWLLDVLCMVPEPGDEESDPGTPDAGGRPAWIRGKDGSWELWFGWARAWEDVDRGRRKLEEGDQQKIKRLLLILTGEKAFSIGRHTGEGGSSRRYIRFTGKHLRVLERIAGGDVPVGTPLTIHAETGADVLKSARKGGKVVDGVVSADA
jgi:hypothetical protein